MDDVRKGQIALLFLKHQLREDGIRLTPKFRRQVGNTAQSIGISFDDAMEFSEIMVRELVEEAFAKRADDKSPIRTSRQNDRVGF